MQEIEKLKQLQSQREALRKRSVEQVEKQQKKPVHQSFYRFQQAQENMQTNHI